MSTRRALLFSFLDRYSALLFSIVSTMVIARLLSPEEIGVFSVSMVLSTLVASFRDMGAGQYLVQEKDLTEERIRAAWTLFLASGCALGLVILAAAGPVSAFYEEPRIRAILQVISLSFFITPFGSMTYAWLMREMKFETLAVMRFASSLVGATVSIALAWKDFGPISLALGNLAGIVTNALVAVAFRPVHFGWKLGISQARRVIGFGGQISISGLLGVLSAGVPELVLAKLQSLLSAGLYSRSNGLAALFHRLVLDATQTVALPLFSRSVRSGEPLGPGYLKALSYVTALGWAFFIGLALLAYPVTRLLYGAQWDDSVPVTQLLAVAFSFGLPACLCPQVMMALGDARGVLQRYAVTLALSVVAIGCGAWLGLLSAAIGFAVVQAVMTVVWTVAVQSRLRFEWKDLAAHLARSLLLATAAGLAPLAAVWLWGSRPVHYAPPIIFSAVGGALLFAAAAIVTSHPISAEVRKAAGALRKLLP